MTAETKSNKQGKEQTHTSPRKSVRVAAIIPDKTAITRKTVTQKTKDKLPLDEQHKHLFNNRTLWFHEHQDQGIEHTELLDMWKKMPKQERDVYSKRAAEGREAVHGRNIPTAVSTVTVVTKVTTGANDKKKHPLLENAEKGEEWKEEKEEEEEEEEGEGEGEQEGLPEQTQMEQSAE